MAARINDKDGLIAELSHQIADLIVVELGLVDSHKLVRGLQFEHQSKITFNCLGQM